MQIVEAQSREGLIAKPLGGLYKPGERGWIKVKTRAYWKYDLEREAILERATRAKGRRPRANAVNRRGDLLTAKRDP